MGWKHVMLIAMLLQFPHTWASPINSLVIATSDLYTEGCPVQDSSCM